MLYLATIVNRSLPYPTLSNSVLPYPTRTERKQICSRVRYPSLPYPTLLYSTPPYWDREKNRFAEGQVPSLYPILLYSTVLPYPTGIQRKTYFQKVRVPFPTIPYPTLFYPTLLGPGEKQICSRVGTLSEPYPILLYSTVPYWDREENRFAVGWGTLPYHTQPYSVLPYSSRTLAYCKSVLPSVAEQMVPQLTVLELT